VTWGNGSEFADEILSAANSIVGSNTTDHVGADISGGALVTTLSNGNYVVVSPSWSNGSGEAGAVTWGNGSIGTSGVVSADNSLVGASNDWYVVPGIAVTPLRNGNYVVENPGWNNARGAVTWCNGSTGTSGAVSAENSLVGGYQANSALNSDIVGVDGIWPLKNGDYVVASAYWNNNMGALTWVSGLTGQTRDGSNTINAQNSVLGANYGSVLYYGVQETPNQTFAVSFASDDPNGAIVVAPSDPSSVAFGFATGHALDMAPSALARALASGTDVTLQASNDITINDPITVNSGAAGRLTLQAGRSIFINASISTGNGNLTLIANDTLLDGVVDGDRQPGAAVLTMAPGTSIDAGTGAVSITMSGDGADGKTNADSGAITLQAIHAGALQVVNSGLSPGSDIDLAGAIDTGAGTQSYQDANGLIMPNGTGLGSAPLTGHVAFAGPSKLAVNINGTQASSQYGLVQALPISTGAINLANLALSVTFGYTPAVGDSWTIIRAGAVTGKFVQGSYLFVDNRLLQIVYGPTSVDLVYITIPAVTITPVSGSGQAIVPETTFAPLQVLVVDSAGNPVPGETVTFKPSAAFYGGTAVTNAQGIATQTGVIAADKAGSYTISATVAGASSPAVFSLASIPGPGTQTVFANLPGYGQPIAGQSFGLQADVLDQWANLATEDNSQVTLTLTGPGPLTDGSNFVTAQAVGGVAAFSGLTLSFAGAYTLTLADGNLTAPAPKTLTLYVGRPAFLELSAPATSATVGAALSSQLSAKVVDSSGNPVFGVPITFTVAGGPNGAGATFAGGVTSTGTSTDSQGLATATVLTANTIAGSYTVTAVAAGTVLQAAVQLTNVHGAAATITPTLGNGETAAVATAFAPLQVTVADAFGNPVPAASVNFAVTAGSGGASAGFTGSGTVSTNADGVATAPLLTAGHTAGSFLVTATVAGVAAPADFLLTCTAGTAADIAAAGGTPQTTPAGSPYPALLQVVLTDAFGNPVANVSVTFTPPASGPGGVFNALSTVLTNALGIATAPALSANTTAGSFTVSATVNGVAAPAVFNLISVAGPAAALVPSAGNSQSVVVRKAYPTALAVQLVDRFGNPVHQSGVTVTFAVVASGKAGRSFADKTTVTTNAQGIATAPTLTANTHAGSFTVTARASSLTAATFNLDSGASAAADPVVSGSQSARVGQLYGKPLEAVVHDAFGNPVSGVAVTFTAPTSGPGGSFAGQTSITVLTNADGVAIAPAFTANTHAGRFVVIVTASGVKKPAKIDLTNLAAVFSWRKSATDFATTSGGGERPDATGAQ
jgi:adhesin/invasin